MAENLFYLKQLIEEMEQDCEPKEGLETALAIKLHVEKYINFIENSSKDNDEDEIQYPKPGFI